MAFVRHAVRFRMSMLLHDLKKYELTQASALCGGRDSLPCIRVVRL